MIVTLLYFKGCPNWHEADAHLRVLATEIPGMEITRRLVETPEDASTLGFRGSPSILVDGVDVFAHSDDPIGLSCRVYETPQGRRGSPTLEQLRAVLSDG